jgi:predicted anti-sigma-YlaC factor YlaD
MTSHARESVHPDLEHYYDRATDRRAIDAHLSTCAQCRAWLDEIHERLGRLACIEFVELVTEYLDEALDDSLRARVDDHLRLCEGCRNYLDEMRATLAAIGRVSEVGPPSDDVRAGLIAAFRAWRDGESSGRVEH